MGGEKVRVVKGERFESDTMLGIDSPIVVWLTDLGALGIGGESHITSHDPGVGASSTGNESPSGGDEPIKPQQTPEYIATCDAVHSLDLAGAVDDGRWFGSFQVLYEDALAQAQQHDDGSAFVGIYVNGVLVGPVVRH